MHDLRDAQWRKSTYSGGDGGNCVEVASNLTSIVAVRDTKNPSSPALACTPANWSTFLSGLKNGALGA
ncbi:DUF397 domain-containing protein [Sphaerisporangium rhizosphaerae]|uniref:DUF397 domain-containing protein n=1 Tax=Sphaerisporangium rhizosphaerae TaxID=2269375 RepID=A0ABW2P7F2_9ACTN